MIRDLIAGAITAIATIVVAWQFDARSLVPAVAVAAIGIIAANVVRSDRAAPAPLTMAGGLVGVAIGPLLRGGAGGYLSMSSVLIGGVALVAAIGAPRFATRVLAGMIAVNLYPMTDTIPFRMWPPFVIEFLVLMLPELRSTIRDERWARSLRLANILAEPLLLTVATWLLVVSILKDRSDALPLLTNYYLPTFGVPTVVATAVIALSRSSARES